ncbi:MAG: TIGR03619 family F420-dependent LLM class oxidoreductase [Pseudomonadota bacterium]
MKIGMACTFGSSASRDFGFVKESAQALEQTGFNSMWVPEHVVFFPPDKIESDYPYDENGTPPWTGDDFGIYDPLFVIAVASQVTTTLRFATSILILPQRPALLTAKEVMTLDHVTQGRFEFGVGGGWAKEEYEALGVSWKNRGKRFDEYIEAIRAAWAPGLAEYKGEFISFENVILMPQPVTPKGPPFLIGGDSIPAMRRAARLGDGWYGWWSDYELEPQLERLQRELEAEGRSIQDDNFRLKLGLPIKFTPDELVAKVEEAQRLGVEELVIGAPVRAKTLQKDLDTWAQAAGVSSH